MFPRYHILLGAIFTLIFFLVFQNTKIIYLLLIFFSSFLIDFDHYFNATVKKRKISLFNAFEYYRIQGVKERKEIASGIRRKSPDFQFFHPIEFHLIVLALSLLWIGFFYIFIGMLFHSLIDIVWLYKEGFLHRREFFFSRWLWQQLRKKVI